MSDFSRRPTVEEIEQLREQVRRDPGSPAFVRLGEAYLALGPPNDAIEVATRGLQANPDSIARRMMIGRAYVMLHQGQPAQTELLKLVKADRNHAAAFALLGGGAAAPSRSRARAARAAASKENITSSKSGKRCDRGRRTSSSK